MTNTCATCYCLLLLAAMTNACAAAWSEPVTQMTPGGLERGKARSSMRAFSTAAPRLAWINSRQRRGLPLLPEARMAATCHWAAKAPVAGSNRQ